MEEAKAGRVVNKEKCEIFISQKLKTKSKNRDTLNSFADNLKLCLTTGDQFTKQF